ncbi:hypothetical protein [Lentibacillus sp. CBA3610]|uniref:hypothetical protein n=1 Tax=Lentibacillus sp. CBA3610 TaxID=2518176 RepID=UPI001595E793|nr:hypothetical protein [Lentibacillus sp. CBA3610]
MKKIVFVSIITITASLAVLMQVEWGMQKFTDTLNVNPDNLTELKLSLPSDSSYKTTDDHETIQEFVGYLKTVKYKKIRGNEPSELPMSGSMIYLYEDEDADFIVLFEDKVLISHYFYEMKSGTIEMEYLRKYYHSIE